LQQLYPDQTRGAIAQQVLEFLEELIGRGLVQVRA